MKKQIIIESCAECPYTFEDQHGLWCSLNPKIRVGDVLIPSNCPLEDADNEETHYMVPKSTLKTAYAKIEGIIIDKNLHPSQCGYTAEIWNVRNELKEILGYGD